MSKRGKTAHDKAHKPDSGRFKCDKCDTTFGAKSALATHLKEIHQAKVARVPCKFKCGKTYGQTRYMDAHAQSCGLNPNKKELACPFCDRVFYLRNRLMEHKREAHNFT